MIHSCFIADGVVIPEQPKGKLKLLFQTVDNIIEFLPPLQNVDEVKAFLGNLITNIGISKRTGKTFYTSQAGCKSPKGDDVDWYIDQWLLRVEKVFNEPDTQPLWELLLDLEIIAPANNMNSTVAQLTWAAIRHGCGKPVAFIPINEILTYRDLVKSRRNEQEAHFNFKQKMLDN
jgi:hypothetical protein